MSLPVLVEELVVKCRRKRSVARFGARLRCLAHIAQQILFGLEGNDYLQKKCRLSKRLKNDVKRTKNMPLHIAMPKAEFKLQLKESKGELTQKKAISRIV